MRKSPNSSQPMLFSHFRSAQKSTIEFSQQEIIPQALKLVKREEQPLARFRSFAGKQFCELSGAIFISQRQYFITNFKNRDTTRSDDLSFANDRSNHTILGQCQILDSDPYCRRTRRYF